MVFGVAAGWRQEDVRLEAATGIKKATGWRPRLRPPLPASGVEKVSKRRHAGGRRRRRQLAARRHIAGNSQKAPESHIASKISFPRRRAPAPAAVLIESMLRKEFILQYIC